MIILGVILLILGLLLHIGILTTVFTAFTLTRLIVAWWVRWTRPQHLAIA